MHIFFYYIKKLFVHSQIFNERKTHVEKVLIIATQITMIIILIKKNIEAEASS